MEERPKAYQVLFTYPPFIHTPTQHAHVNISAIALSLSLTAGNMMYNKGTDFTQQIQKIMGWNETHCIAGIILSGKVNF